MNKMTVDINILGKIYQVKCPEAEVESLKKAAEMLENKMQHTRDKGVMLSNDRIAVITSLNLTHQVMLLEQKTSHFTQTIHEKLHDLQNKIETALAHNAQMELASAE